MNIKGKIAALGVAALVASAAAASAGTIQLNVNRGWTQGTHTYSNAHHTVTVEARNYTGAGILTSADPWLASWSGSAGGIGICNPRTDDRHATSGGCTKDEHTVDGEDPNEMAIFNFGSLIVKLKSITFAYSDKYDLFDVFLYGNGTGHAPTGSDTANTITSSATQATRTVSNFSLAAGSIFGIGVSNHSGDVKIQAIHYEVVPVNVIPLPAAGWMLLAGMGGLAAMRRIRKAA
jgi:hypothetical protein